MLRAERVYVGRGTCFHIQLCAPSCKTFPLHFLPSSQEQLSGVSKCFLKCLGWVGCLAHLLVCVRDAFTFSPWLLSIDVCVLYAPVSVQNECTYAMNSEHAVWFAPGGLQRDQTEGMRGRGNVLYIPSICLAIATACIWTVLAWRLVFKKESSWVLDIGGHVWHDFLELIFLEFP